MIEPIFCQRIADSSQNVQISEKVHCINVCQRLQTKKQALKARSFYPYSRSIPAFDAILSFLTFRLTLFEHCIKKES